MKFHLSTLLLAMVIVALGLGWYLDHNNPRRTNIVGSWRTARFSGYLISYFTNLEIREDGTFSKSQSDRRATEVYEGTYQTLRDGTVVFHVTLKKTFHPYWHKDNDIESSKQVTLDHKFKLHCAIDPSGLLLMSSDHESDNLWGSNNTGLPYPLDKNQDCKIIWESLYRRSE